MHNLGGKKSAFVMSQIALKMPRDGGDFALVWCNAAVLAEDYKQRAKYAVLQFFPSSFITEHDNSALQVVTI